MIVFQAIIYLLAFYYLNTCNKKMEVVAVFDSM